MAAAAVRRPTAVDDAGCVRERRCLARSEIADAARRCRATAASAPAAFSRRKRTVVRGDASVPVPEVRLEGGADSQMISVVVVVVDDMVRMVAFWASDGDRYNTLQHD